MAQRSYNTLNRDQENYAPSLTMGGGIIDDGEMRVQSDARGNMVLTEHTDNMMDNYKSGEQTAGSISTSLNNAKSHGVNLSDRHSTQTSVTDAQNIDVARNVARGTTHAEGLTLSQTESLRRQLGVTDSSSTSDSTGDSKSTGTNSHIDAKTPGALSALTGVGAGTSTTASNSKDVKHDLTEQERQEAQVAMDKIRTAARTGGLTSTNSDDMRLNQSFASNLSELDQISHEKAQTMQDIDTLSKQLSYVQTNSGTIDRNANDRVMKEVMRQHPELHSKEQAARWMKSHRSEADSIARPIINDSNPFPASSTHLNYGNSGSRAAKLEGDTQNLRNEPIATEDSLKQKHEKNTAKVQKYASVQDNTGKEKPLSEVVNNTIKDSKKDYNKDVGEVLTTNLNPQEKESVGKLEKSQEKRLNNKAKVDKAKADVYGSTIVRVVESIGDDSTAVHNGATAAVDWVVDKVVDKK